MVRFYNKRGTAEQWIKEGKQAVKMTRLSCHRFRSNQVRLALSLLAYNLGNLWRRLALPKNRGLVADESAATAGEDRRTAGQTCALLLVIAGGRTSEPAAVRGDAGPDRATAGTGGIDRWRSSLHRKSVLHNHLAGTSKAIVGRWTNVIQLPLSPSIRPVSSRLSLTTRGLPSAAGTGSHGALAPAIPISIAWSSSELSRSVQAHITLAKGDGGAMARDGSLHSKDKDENGNQVRRAINPVKHTPVVSPMPLAARLLKLFCYSARPQWDDFGHLSSHGGRAKVDKTISLSERFGPEIWKTLKDQKVLDYGCGFGADVLECARHEVDATGFEVRQFLVQGARRRAERAGVRCSFYQTNECTDLQGTVDVILSVNCFEHYLDPAGVLEHMRQVLKSQGVVLVYFCPPWLHPYGGHSQEMTPLPWVHLIFPERTVVRVRAEYYQEKATSYEEAAGGLSRMTIAKFKRVVASSPFAFRKLELLPLRNVKVLTKIPAVREFFTAAIRAELVPRDSAAESTCDRAGFGSRG